MVQRRKKDGTGQPSNPTVVAGGMLTRQRTHVGGSMGRGDGGVHQSGATGVGQVAPSNNVGLVARVSLMAGADMGRGSATGGAGGGVSGLTVDAGVPYVSGQRSFPVQAEVGAGLAATAACCEGRQLLQNVGDGVESPPLVVQPASGQAGRLHSGGTRSLAGDDHRGHAEEVVARADNVMAVHGGGSVREGAAGERVTPVGMEASPRSWKDLFAKEVGNSTHLPLKFVSPAVANGERIADVDLEEVVGMKGVWNKAVVFLPIGISPPIDSVIRFVAAAWKHVAKPRVQFHRDGFYVIVFQSSADCESVLAGGQYTMGGLPVVIRK